MDGSRYQVVIVGVGGAGCNTITELRAQWPSAPEMIAIHSLVTALEACPADRKIRVGATVTQGAGAGGDPEVGRKAVESSIEDIRALFTGVDLAIVSAGLGGGTGSGGAPLICAAARDMGALVLAVVTLPFFFEGSRRRMCAEAALKEIRESADAVVVFPNQRVIEWVDEGAQVGEAFRMVDHVVGGGLRTLWKLVTEPGHMKLDFSDLRRMIRLGGGTLAMATAEVAGDDRVRDALEEIQNSPLLDRGALIPTARNVLIGVACGPDFKLAEMEKLSGALSGKTRPDVHLHVGVAVDPEFEGRLNVTVLLAEGEESGGENSPAAPSPGPDSSVPPGTEAANGVKPGRKSKSAKPVQPLLRLDSTPKGRFRDVQPTYHDGVDMDVPTYIRRRISLSRPSGGAL